MNYRGISVKLNESLNQSVKLQLYVDEGSGFVSSGAAGYAEYNSESTVTDGVWFTEVIYRFPEEIRTYLRRKAKVVMTYTLKNGKTGTIESQPFWLYAGRYASLKSAEYDGTALRFAIEIDTSMVTMEPVDVSYIYFHYIDSEGKVVKYEQPDSLKKEGNLLMAEYRIGEGKSELNYTFLSDVEWDDGEGSMWSCFVQTDDTIH